MTKTMLQQEWAMTIEQAVEAEAQAQAICMQTQDFTRAYDAFAAKQKPRVRRGLSDAAPTATWPCRSSTTRTATWRAPGRLGAAAGRWTKHDDRAACREWVRRWVTPAGCATACRQPLAARWSGWIRARW
jgi:hypothetical protein